MDSFISLFDPGCSDETPSSSSSSSSSICKIGNRQKGFVVQNQNGIVDNNNYPGVMERRGNKEGDDNNIIHDLPPEPQLGNIEYKLKLVNPSRHRFEHLVTQMNWRLREGQGEAIYEIGVEDCGRLRGLSIQEMADSLKTLNEMAKKLNATLTILRESVVASPNSSTSVAEVKKVIEVLVRRIPDVQPSIELRVAVMGNENAGKSTILGVLTQGELDDGRGRARLNVFRHLHEVETGRTSSISHEIIGFDAKGRVINYQEGSPETICEMSTKVVTLIDLAGHKKYLKTTLHGISGYSPHYIFFVISASQGFAKHTMDYLALASVLQIPLAVIITKTDLVSREKLDETVEDVMEYLNGIGHKPYRISNNDDVLAFVGNQNHEIDVPVLCLSSVTGVGLDLVSKLLFFMQPGLSSIDRDRLEKELPVFQIDEMFRIPQKGIILGGLLKEGIIKERSSLLLGPFYDGSFLPVCVDSIRRHKTPCLLAKAGQSVSLSLGTNNIKGLRKGMVLVSPQLCPKATYYFQASISVLYHCTAISKGFQTTVHIGNVTQTAIIEEILSMSHITTNERAVVLFRFIKNPEFLIVGSQLLFRDGSNQGLGTVTHSFPFDFTL